MTADQVYGLIDFPLFLILGESLIDQYFPRRNYFWIRAVICSIAVIAFNFLRDFSYVPIGWLNSAIQTTFPLITFALSLIGLNICFKATIPSILLAGTVGYCIQNFSYCLMSIIRISIGFDQSLWYYVIAILAPIFCLTYFTTYFIYLRNKDLRIGIDKIQEKRQILITLMALAGISILSCYAMMTSSKFDSKGMWYCTYSFDMIVGIIIVTTELELLRSRRNAIDKMKVQTLWEIDKRNYAKNAENMDFINVKMHDLKHRLDNLSTKVDKEELDSLKSSLDVFKFVNKTNCEALDMVLAEKEMKMVKSKIHFTCLVDASKINYIPKENLYSLFENSISNAIEAVTQLPEGKRVIAVTSKDYGDYINIHIENYCDKDKVNTKIGITTKSDKSMHGFGLKSIEMMMKEYKGKMSIKLKEDIFSLDLLFPIQFEETNFDN